MALNLSKVNGEVNDCETEPNSKDMIDLLNEFCPPTNRALGTGMVCRAGIFFPLYPANAGRLIGAHRFKRNNGKT